MARGQRNVHHVKLDMKPLPFKEPIRDIEKANAEEDCQVKKVPLDKHLHDKMVTIRVSLEEQEEKELLEFLIKNKDVFAWSTGDLRGLIEHRLNIDPSIRPKNKSFTKCPMTRWLPSKCPETYTKMIWYSRVEKTS